MPSSRREKAARRRSKREQQQPDAPQPGAFEHLLVGMLRKPHGIKGELLLGVLTDFPERIVPGAVFILGSNHEEVTVQTVRHHNKGLLLRFEEYPDVDSIEWIRNVPLLVRADDRPPLPDGEYYQHQLLGLDVVTDTGDTVGILIGFIPTGANDVYRVRTPDGKEILLPAIDEVILNVDLETRQIQVHLLEGLL